MAVAVAVAVNPRAGPDHPGHAPTRTPTPTPVPISTPTPRETAASNFLPLINAGARYAGSSGGRGRVVAVIDDGVDFSHPDLSGREYAYSDATNPREHGTPVAGTIAARRNGRGMHGVAYNASLVSLANCFATSQVQLNRCSPTERRLGQTNVLASDIASAAGLVRSYGGARSNPAASSHIMNMSWGPTLGRVSYGTSTAVLSAMRDAAGAGRIMVAALGNSGLPGPEGGPASVVGDSRIAGLGIAVGALNSTGTGRARVQQQLRHGVGSAVLSVRARRERLHNTSRRLGASQRDVLRIAGRRRRGGRRLGRISEQKRPPDRRQIARYRQQARRVRHFQHLRQRPTGS